VIVALPGLNVSASLAEIVADAPLDAQLAVDEVELELQPSAETTKPSVIAR
jgi:hypothetical protein